MTEISKSKTEASDVASTLAALLKGMGIAVRQNVVTHRDLVGDSAFVEHAGGDAVFAIDKKVEPIVVAAIEQWPPELLPILLIAEGLGEDGRRYFGNERSQPRYRLLIDPIDGTRGLMYDKRSAWYLAAIAEDQGEETRLSEAVASVMVEIPTSKQILTDTFVYSKGQPLVAIRERLDTAARTLLTVSPSRETSLRYGFGQVSNFFPGTKQLAAELMEQIATATVGELEIGDAAIFDDQYMSTGGQLVELAMGRDRFCCDLRPLLYMIIERRTGRPVNHGLECHPYDMAGMMVAKAAGVILTDGYGRELGPRLNVSDGVHWCGYANDSLRAQIEPVIQTWLKRNLSE